MALSRVSIAFILYGLFTCASFVFLYLNLQGLRSDAETINQAGKQRMLSQRIALAVIRKQANSNIHEESSKLLIDAKLMRDNHLALVHHQPHPNRNLSTSLNNLYFSNTPSLYQRVLDFTNEAEKASRSIDFQHVNTALFDEKRLTTLLSDLDKVVAQYEMEANEKLIKVSDLLLGLLILHGLGILIVYSLVHQHCSKSDS